MNRREHLLTILIEECSELAKEACKILRFGYNAEKQIRLEAEFNEIVALIEMLGDEGIVAREYSELINAKKARVEKYLLESKELGTLEE